MSEWKEKRFGDLVSFPPKVKLIKGKEYPFILMEEIEPKTKFVNTNISKPYDGSGSRFENGDTLFARITPSLENGKIAQARGLNNPGFGSTELYVFRAKKNISDKDFIYYLCRADYFIQNAVNSYVGASGRQRADAKFIANTILKVPDFKEQQQIASILSAYDELIENNNRRIAILEQMAEQIYKEWFVRMRFPGYENTEFEKGVPKKWDTKSLFDVIYVDYGFPFKSELFNEDGVGKTVIRIRDLQNGVSKTFTPEIADKRFNINDGDILVGMDGDFHFCKWASGEAWLNQRNLRLRAKKENLGQYFIYHSLKPQIQYLNEIIVGTTVAHLSDKDLRKLKLVLPKDDIQNKFNELVEPIYKQEILLKQKIHKLKQTRDLLLPRLISGKFKVSSFAKAPVDKKEAEKEIKTV